MAVHYTKKHTQLKNCTFEIKDANETSLGEAEASLSTLFVAFRKRDQRNTLYLVVNQHVFTGGDRTKPDTGGRFAIPLRVITVLHAATARSLVIKWDGLKECKRFRGPYFLEAHGDAERLGRFAMFLQACQRREEETKGDADIAREEIPPSEVKLKKFDAGEDGDVTDFTEFLKEFTT